MNILFFNIFCFKFFSFFLFSNNLLLIIIIHLIRPAAQVLYGTGCFLSSVYALNCSTFRVLL